MNGTHGALGAGQAFVDFYTIWRNTLIEATFVEHAFSISAATQANPVRLTTTANHGFGDASLNHNTTPLQMTITGVVGMTELNSNNYYCKVIDATTLDLYTDSSLSSSVDGTGFTAYTSGGAAAVTAADPAQCMATNSTQ